MGNRLKRGRGRPKKLDRNQVLDFVMISYWNDGPTYVSINDICKKLGISDINLQIGFQQAAAPSNYDDNHNDALENSTVSVCVRYKH